MEEMKHYLERNSTFGQSLLVIGAGISLVGSLVMAGFAIDAGIPFFMVIIMLCPFLLMGAVCVFAFRANVRAFPRWWDSLTEAQQADYLQDFRNAWKHDSFLLLGEKYAYIHHIGQPFTYAEIVDIDFQRSRSRTVMLIDLRSGKRLTAALPAFTSRSAIYEILMERKGMQY